MRVVFIGTVEFSASTLKQCIANDAGVIGVLTKKTSTFNADFFDLADICIEHNIPYRHVENVNDESNLRWIRALDPDFIFCFGFSSLLKAELLSIPRQGTLGFHPAELPKNRGRHPIIWALALGLKQTASTFFFMDEGADSGDILSQEIVPISDDDDALSLYNLITQTALRQMNAFIPSLKNGTFQRMRQDHSQANSWRKRGRNDGLIDFRMSTSAIHNLIRALARPYVGAHLLHNGKEIKVWKAQKSALEAGMNLEPGKILAVRNSVVSIKTGDGAIDVIEHEFSELPIVGEYL